MKLQENYRIKAEAKFIEPSKSFSFHLEHRYSGHNKNFQAIIDIDKLNQFKTPVTWSAWFYYKKHLISLRNNTGGTFVGNTDKFDMIANSYDTSERVQIAKVSSDAIKAYLVDTKSKDAIDFGCGTGLVGMSLLNEFRAMLFLDTSQNMLNIVDQKISDSKAVNASTLCFDFETSTQPSIRADYIFMAQVLLHIQDFESVLSKLYDI